MSVSSAAHVAGKHCAALWVTRSLKPLPSFENCTILHQSDGHGSRSHSRRVSQSRAMQNSEERRPQFVVPAGSIIAARLNRVLNIAGVDVENWWGRRNLRHPLLCSVGTRLESRTRGLRSATPTPGTFT